MINVWIYRPDMRQKVDPYLCYNSKGQSFGEWRKEQDIIYQYKVEQAKREIEIMSTPKKHYIKEG